VALTALLVLAIVGTGIASAQTASDGSLDPDLEGPCSVQATIPGVGTIDPSASGGVYTVPHQGSATYTASINVSGEDRMIDGAVTVSTPPGIPSFDIRDPWQDDSADENSDTDTVDWDIPSWVPGGITMTVSGFHNDEGASCSGSIHVKLEGGITDSPLGIISLVMTVLTGLGLIGAAFPLR
jgi:hypothetical protein